MHFRTSPRRGSFFQKKDTHLQRVNCHYEKKTESFTDSLFFCFFSYDKMFSPMTVNDSHCAEVHSANVGLISPLMIPTFAEWTKPNDYYIKGH